ncbi:MAG TPA: SgcJ/EcaC family oxidoreductase [Gammaproteobacteria bacterium]|jgi:uncharacterized protein (TIGR02246 family)|nr:SgcJ/EcaC family oxidoreductase [Gammaproteobacteria bacterium]
MTRAIVFVIAALVLAAPAVCRAQRTEHAGDEAAIRAVVQAFLDTREKNDAAALAALLTADVDQQQTSGNTRRGRDAVVKGSLATQQSTGGRRTITLESIRFVTADVAIADGRYDSLGRADGSDRHMLTSMVLKREAGSWKIAAIRNTLPTQER